MTKVDKIMKAIESYPDTEQFEVIRRDDFNVLVYERDHIGAAWLNTWFIKYLLKVHFYVYVDYDEDRQVCYLHVY